MPFISRSGAQPHDPSLLEKLSERGEGKFEGEFFRATRVTADPTAFSPNGGRWAPPSTYLPVPVLYTSTARDGAIAEIASYLALLVPPPSKKLLVHKLRVSARKVISLNEADLTDLGIETAAYQERRYAKPGERPPSRSQEIGAALNFLGYDALIVPSARWPCDNFIIFGDNHDLQCDLEITGREEIDWQTWLRSSGGRMLRNDPEGG